MIFFCNQKEMRDQKTHKKLISVFFLRNTHLEVQTPELTNKIHKLHQHNTRKCFDDGK